MAPVRVVGRGPRKPAARRKLPVAHVVGPKPAQCLLPRQQDPWYGYPGPAYPPREGEPIRVFYHARFSGGDGAEAFAQYLAEAMKAGVQWFYLVEGPDAAQKAQLLAEQGEVEQVTDRFGMEWWQFLRLILDFRPHVVHADSDRYAEFAERVGVPCVRTAADADLTPENYLMRYREAVWPVTDIIILAHKELEVTRTCVQHIMANTWAPYRLILVDNGSTEPVADFFHLVCAMLGGDRCLVLEPGENLGCPAGRDLAYQHVNTPYFACIDNDMFVPPGWLGPLLSRIRAQPETGMIAPWSDIYSPDLRGKPPHPRNVVGMNNLFRTQAVRDAEEEPGQLHPEPFRSLQGRADTDLLWRVKEAGYQLWFDASVQLRHVGGPLHSGFGQGLTRRKGDIAGMQRADVAFKAKWATPGVRRITNSTSLAPKPRKKRKRIRLLTFVPNAWWGGLHNWTQYLVKYLSQDEFELHFLIRRQRLDGGEALRQYGSVQKIAANTRQEWASVIREVLVEARPQVVQANASEMARAAQRLGIPCVTTGHSMVGADANGAEFADRVFRVSPAIPGDSPVILNGVDAPPSRPRTEGLIVYLGRLDRDRNPQAFFNGLNVLWRRRQDFTVRVVGANMQGGFKPGHFPWADGLKERVELTGLVPHERALELVADGDLVTAPWPEGFGLGVAEGMRVGCIPVVSDGGFGPGLVGEYGITVGGKPDEIADGLARALDDRSLRDNRDEIAAWAADRYDAKRFSAEYADVYRELGG